MKTHGPTDRTGDQTNRARRDFLKTGALALFAGVAVSIFGCATDSDGGGKEGSVSANHGHRAFITDAQMSAGGAVTLGISGSAGHDHSLTLTAEQVAAIRAGTQVLLTSSSTGGHSHVVAFN